MRMPGNFNKTTRRVATRVMDEGGYGVPPQKLATGGRAKKGTTVNIVIPPSQQQPQKIPVPVPVPHPMAGGPPPGGPPPGAMPPGAGGPPPGMMPSPGAMPPGMMPPGARPPGMKRGGAVKVAVSRKIGLARKPGK